MNFFFVCLFDIIDTGKGETNTQCTRVELRKIIDGGNVRLLQVKDWFVSFEVCPTSSKSWCEAAKTALKQKFTMFESPSTG